MNLTNQTIEDTYGNVITMGTAAGQPTAGNLYNGAGMTVTSIDVATVNSTTHNVGVSNIDKANLVVHTHRVVEQMADGSEVGPFTTVVIPGGGATLRMPIDVEEGMIVRLANESGVKVDVLSSAKFTGLNPGQPFDLHADEKLYTFIYHESSVNGPSWYVHN